MRARTRRSRLRVGLDAAARARKGEFDIVVAQYHDQGLIPVKYLGIEQGVNVTIGLPFVRTSVDHGTAFDIAGQGVADASSLIEAVRETDAVFFGVAAAARDGIADKSLIELSIQPPLDIRAPFGIVSLAGRSQSAAMGIVSSFIRDHLHD
mgnify:CR=1 FL=1